MGGMVKAIEQRLSAKGDRRGQLPIPEGTEAREKITVGANEFTIEEQPPAILYIGEAVGERQKAKLRALRARRDNQAVRHALEALKRAAAMTPDAGRRRKDLRGQHHALHPGCGAGVCDGRRNLRRVARGLRELSGVVVHLS